MENMKKSFVALAIAGAFSTAVHAQSAIEMYGVVDMGFVRETGTVIPASPVSGNKLQSGVQSGSRVGFKGTEDLGGGLKALFVLETGIQADRGGFSQGGLAFGRQSFVGVQGDFGTVTLGRQYTPYFLTLFTVADPFAAGMAGASQNLMLAPTSSRPNQGIRMDDTIKYTSPIFSGISGEVAYGFGERPDSNSAGRVVSASIGYNVKPVNVRLAYYRANNTGTPRDETASVLLAGSFDLGVAKIHAAYADSEEFLDRKTRDYLIGATIPMGPHTFLVSYIAKDDRSALNQDANQVAVGYTYALSKRTNLYASYARLTDAEAGSSCAGGITTYGGTHGSIAGSDGQRTGLNGGASAFGEWGMNVGIRHTF